MNILIKILRILFFVLLLWGLIHFFAIFGIFIAAGFLILWFVIPRKIPCIACNLKRQGRYCYLCQRKIDKSANTSPKSVRSAFLNFVIIIAFTLVSIGVVLVEKNILELLEPASPTATFSIPTERQYEVGEVFPVAIEVIGIDYPINAVQADLGFDPQVVEALDVVTDESFATIFIQKKINNEEGYVRLTGGLPAPGYKLGSGTFGTVYFRALRPGPVEIKYLPSSLVLANDGEGTNVLVSTGFISHLIISDELLTDENIDIKDVEEEKDVLGEKSGTRLELFDKGDVFETGGVLGQEVGKLPIMQQENIKSTKAVLDLIRKINAITLGVWLSLLI